MPGGGISNTGATVTLQNSIVAGSLKGGNCYGTITSNGQLLTTDQRGQPRPDKEDTGGCDMGTYERPTD